MTLPMMPFTGFRPGLARAIAWPALVLFGLALVADPPLASLAARAAPVSKAFGRTASWFGLSGYMLAIAAFITIAAGTAAAYGRRRVFGLPPQLLAERAAYFFAAIALSGILAQIVKHVVGRARPKLMAQLGPYHLDPLSLKGSLASFPSGHAATAFAAAFCLSCFMPRGRLLFYAAALTIALARILSGEHYPSDVVAGGTLGTLTSLWLARRFGERHLAFDWHGPALRPRRDGQAAAPSPGEPRLHAV